MMGLKLFFVVNATEVNVVIVVIMQEIKQSFIVRATGVEVTVVVSVK